jgi:hypothetical protein
MQSGASSSFFLSYHITWRCLHLHGCVAPDLNLGILGKQTGPNKKKRLFQKKMRRKDNVKRLVSISFIFSDILKQQNCNYH